MPLKTADEFTGRNKNERCYILLYTLNMKSLLSLERGSLILINKEFKNAISQIRKVSQNTIKNKFNYK